MTRTKGNESAGSDNAMFREGQLLVVVGEEVDTEEYVEMTEAITEKRMGWKRTEDGLLLVAEEHQEARPREHHDSMVAGYWRAERTAGFISRNYCWPNLRATVEAYVMKCDRCQRAKPDSHERKTALKPIPIGNGPWQKIAMDFVVALP